MRKFIYLLWISVFLAFYACNSKNGASKSDNEIMMQDSIDAHGLQRMQMSKTDIDITFKGKEYHSYVSRTPDENLAHVKNEMGDTYLDNKIVLRLTRGGETVLDKTFTKSDFASVVDSDFLSKSILEGLVYDKTTPQGIVYAASVCYPGTDLYVPLSITVTSDGKVTIEKVDTLDEYVEDMDTVRAQ